MSLNVDTHRVMSSLVILYLLGPFGSSWSWNVIASSHMYHITLAEIMWVLVTYNNATDTRLCRMLANLEKYDLRCFPMDANEI